MSEIEASGDSPFFVGVMSFLLIKLLLQIADLDNLFAAGRAMTAKNVSLIPVSRGVHRLNRMDGGCPTLRDGPPRNASMTAAALVALPDMNSSRLSAE